MSVPPPRHTPRFVHAPATLRVLVRTLGKLDSKARKSLFWQANSLLNDGSADRIAKCLTYSLNKTMSRKVLQAALISLRNRIYLSLMHPYDVDSTIDLFLVLRRYTFEIEGSDVCRILKKLHVPIHTADRIAGIASKVGTGITPRTYTKGTHWDQKAIDRWLSDAESSA